MPARALAARTVLGGLLLATAPACSGDDERRDQNFGSDIGRGYRFPDGGTFDTAPDAGVANDGARDGARDQGASADGVSSDAVSDGSSEGQDGALAAGQDAG